MGNKKPFKYWEMIEFLVEHPDTRFESKRYNSIFMDSYGSVCYSNADKAFCDGGILTPYKGNLVDEYTIKTETFEFAKALRHMLDGKIVRWGSYPYRIRKNDIQWQDSDGNWLSCGQSMLCSFYDSEWSLDEEEA